MNSSHRFSARAEVALTILAGHPLLVPEQLEARFRSSAAEQSFVLSTRPAVGLQVKLISSSTRAPLYGGVAFDARY